MASPYNNYVYFCDFLLLSQVGDVHTLNADEKSCQKRKAACTCTRIVVFLPFAFIHSPAPLQIAPRLANCVHCVKEGRELRKPIRDLFDAGKHSSCT